MELPQDMLFFNILPRLPGNSVVRFKRVSKEWYSFLSSPLFKKMHFLGISNDQHQNPHKLLLLSDTTPCTFRTIDCEAPEDGFTPSRIVPFELKGKNIRILTTFHGLVCVGIGTFIEPYVSSYSDVIVWNPLTGDHKTLSKTNCEREWSELDTYKLYYNSSDDDYKLLHCIIERNCCDIYMHSLTSNSWRKITSANKVIRCENYSQSWWVSELLNENIYLLKPTYGIDNLRTIVRMCIVRFNTKTENLTEIEFPIFRLKNKRSRFILLKGCIHIFVTIADMWTRDELQPTVKLWRLDEDEKWTQVATYVPAEGFLYNPWPVHVMRNGNWLMMHLKTKTEGHFYKVDIEKNTKDKICSSTGANMDANIPKRKNTSFDIYAGKYFETFVSPNLYIK